MAPSVTSGEIGVDSSSRDVIADRYDLILLDLDGVVYRGASPVPSAAVALQALRGRGARILFVTNNSSRTAEDVSQRLRRMGIAASADEVLTSAQATASMLAREGLSGASAFVIGERGVRDALAGAGVTVVEDPSRTTDLVVVGWDRSVDYSKLRMASLLLQRGARLIATNADASYPAPDGLWPGAGAILAAITTATGVTPTIVGKPHRPLFEAAVDATGAGHPLMVGDRLDTDIAGARSMGWDSLLVLTGASTMADLPRSDDLPVYVGHDLGAVLDSTPPGRFRWARPDDLAALHALLEGAGLVPGRLTERLPSTLVCATRPDHMPEASTLVATASLERIAEPGPAAPPAALEAGPKPGGSATGVGAPVVLRSVAVDPFLRGKGIGALLVSRVVREARRLGGGAIYVFTETASGFFERLGFVAVRRDMLPRAVRASSQALEECAESAVPMVLALEGQGGSLGETGRRPAPASQ
jgi:glycerol 3-phosphatase-2